MISSNSFASKFPSCLIHECKWCIRWSHNQYIYQKARSVTRRPHTHSCHSISCESISRSHACHKISPVKNIIFNAHYTATLSTRDFFLDWIDFFFSLSLARFCLCLAVDFPKIGICSTNTTIYYYFDFEFDIISSFNHVRVYASASHQTAKLHSRFRVHRIIRSIALWPKGVKF